MQTPLSEQLNIDTSLSRGKTRFVTFVLALVMIFESFTQLVYADPGDVLFEFKGTGDVEALWGTELDPYVITGEQGLRELEFNMKLEPFYTVGKYFILKTDDDSLQTVANIAAANDIVNLMSNIAEIIPDDYIAAHMPEDEPEELPEDEPEELPVCQHTERRNGKCSYIQHDPNRIGERP